MDFIRKIVTADELVGIIDIPERMRKFQLEVIVLPVKIPGTKAIGKKNRARPGKSFSRLFKSPIKVDKIKTFSREELHER